MKFLFLVSCPEDCALPPKSFMDYMEASARRAENDGTMIENGGLAPSSRSHRVRVRQNAVSVIDGPFAEAKEIIGGYAIMELPSREAALESATWLMNAHKEHWPGWEGQVEVREMLARPEFEQAHSG
jgi:hypothetical protein